MKSKKVLVILITIILFVVFGIIIFFRICDNNTSHEKFDYNEIYNYANSLTDNKNLVIDSDFISICLSLDVTEIDNYIFAVDPDNNDNYIFITKNLPKSQKEILQNLFHAYKVKNPERYKKIVFDEVSNYTYVVSLDNNKDVVSNAIYNYIKNY